MKPVSKDLIFALERMKTGNDFELFTVWLEESFASHVEESLDAVGDHLIVNQGYLRALRDINNTIGNSKKTLDTMNKRG